MHNSQVQLTKPTTRRNLPGLRDGWHLDAVAALDRYGRPGFLREFLEADRVAKHAILAVFAEGHLPDLLAQVGADAEVDGCRLGVLADLLLSLEPRALIEAGFGLAPHGIIGALARIEAPLARPEAYAELIEILALPHERRRRIALRYSRSIDADRIAGLRLLAEPLCHPRLAHRVSSITQARQANDILAVVRQHRPDVTDDAVFEFVSQADPSMPLADQLERLLEHFVVELPALPFDLNPEVFTPLRTRQGFVRAGLEFRNCLKTKFGQYGVTGRAAYVLYKPRPAIAVLIQLTQGWMLGRVHAPRNSELAPGLGEEVRNAFVAAGVSILIPAPLTAEMQSVWRLYDRHDPFGFGHDEIEGFEGL